MTTLLNLFLAAALIIYALLLITVVLKALIWGENVINRLLGIELSSTLIIGILVLIAIRSSSNLLLDIALGFAVLAFVSTTALARYLSDQQVF
jgi:multisubunit Na+/H+ antiporter MnhF subunit